MKTLKEISNKAVGRSIMALSKLLKKNVQLTIANAKVKNVEGLALEVYQSRVEEGVVGIYLPTLGSIVGSSLLVFNKVDANRLCDVLTEGLPNEGGDNTRNSALKEVGNIVIGNFLTVLANELHIQVMSGTPELRHGRFSLILDEVIAHFVNDAKEGLVIEINFVVELLTLRGQLICLFNHQHCREILALLSDVCAD